MSQTRRKRKERGAADAVAAVHNALNLPEVVEALAGEALAAEREAIQAATQQAEQEALIAATQETESRPDTAFQLKRVVEGLIFASDRPLTVPNLRQYLGNDVGRQEIQEALDLLVEDYSQRGIVLHDVAGGYQFRTHPSSSEWIQKLIAGRPVRLSRAQLDTLAIVAYRQPITRPEIDDIRGVDSASTVKVLLDRSMLRILGKKEEVGRPLLYGTSKEFLEFFNLAELRDLPTLREFHELNDEGMAQVDKLGADISGVDVGAVAAQVAKEREEEAIAAVARAEEEAEEKRLAKEAEKAARAAEKAEQKFDRDAPLVMPLSFAEAAEENAAAVEASDGSEVDGADGLDAADGSALADADGADNSDAAEALDGSDVDGSPTADGTAMADADDFEAMDSSEVSSAEEMDAPPDAPEEAVSALQDADGLDAVEGAADVGLDATEADVASEPLSVADEPSEDGDEPAFDGASPSPGEDETGLHDDYGEPQPSELLPTDEAPAEGHAEVSDLSDSESHEGLEAPEPLDDQGVDASAEGSTLVIAGSPDAEVPGLEEELLATGDDQDAVDVEVDELGDSLTTSAEASSFDNSAPEVDAEPVAAFGESSKRESGLAYDDASELDESPQNNPEEVFEGPESVAGREGSDAQLRELDATSDSESGADAVEMDERSDEFDADEAGHVSSFEELAQKFAAQDEGDVDDEMEASPDAEAVAATPGDDGWSSAAALSDDEAQPAHEESDSHDEGELSADDADEPRADAQDANAALDSSDHDLEEPSADNAPESEAPHASVDEPSSLDETPIDADEYETDELETEREEDAMTPENDEGNEPNAEETLVELAAVDPDTVMEDEAAILHPSALADASGFVVEHTIPDQTVPGHADLVDPSDAFDPAATLVNMTTAMPDVTLVDRQPAPEAPSDFDAEHDENTDVGGFVGEDTSVSPDHADPFSPEPDADIGAEQLDETNDEETP